MDYNINYIKEGLIYYSRNSSCAKDERLFKYDKEILKVAISTYKNDKGAYPDDLKQLKKYIDEKYRTRLRIQDPCFSEYTFDVKENVDVITIKSLYDE